MLNYKSRKIVENDSAVFLEFKSGALVQVNIANNGKDQNGKCDVKLVITDFDTKWKLYHFKRFNELLRIL